MPGKLLQELQRDQPFDSPHQELFLNVVRTADHLSRGFEELFKPFGLSVTQYNLLRILGFATDQGLPCKKIGERMLTRDPDITRLLDRLEARQLISRQRDNPDRRVVAVRITPAGKELLSKLKRPVFDFHVAQLGHLSESDCERLIAGLEAVREVTARPRREP